MRSRESMLQSWEGGREGKKVGGTERRKKMEVSDLRKSVVRG